MTRAALAAVLSAALVAAIPTALLASPARSPNVPPAAAPTPEPTPGTAAPRPRGTGPVGGERTSDPRALALLDRAVEAARALPHRGLVTVASFSADGPQITTVRLVRAETGSFTVERRGAWELGRDEAGGFLRSTRTGALLRLGGLERPGVDRDRFLSSYVVVEAGTTELDTGSAHTLEIRRRASGTLREVVHLDDVTDLIVRRETYDTDGAPVRVVAFTELRTEDVPLVRGPTVDEVTESGVEPVERAALLEAGVPVPETLPGGFELVDGHDVEGTEVPTVRLVYVDGLYTLSLFIQEGRLAQQATEGASEVATPTGGTVWRWPGSEPRRVVWTGGGRTFTALSDAPTDDVVLAIAGFPNDPPASTLQRLTRGLSRVGQQLAPPWGD